jgi:hypothetical protein
MRSKKKQKTHLDWHEFDYRFNFGLLTLTNEGLPERELTGFSAPSEQSLRKVLVRPVLLVYGDDAYVVQFHSWGTIILKADRTFPRNTLARVRYLTHRATPIAKCVNPLTGLLLPRGISQSAAGVFFHFNSKVEMVNSKGELYDCASPTGLHGPGE